MRIFALIFVLVLFVTLPVVVAQTTTPPAGTSLTQLTADLGAVKTMLQRLANGVGVLCVVAGGLFIMKRNVSAGVACFIAALLLFCFDLLMTGITGH